MRTITSWNKIFQLKIFLLILIIIPYTGKTQNIDTAAEKTTVTSQQQYAADIDFYLHGHKCYKLMPWMANISWSLDKKQLANTIAIDYIGNYLLKLNDSQLYNRENLNFIRRYNQSSNNQSFLLFYNHVEKIDSVMGEREYALNYIDYIIAKEEIDPRLWKDDKSVTEDPDWRQMGRTIGKKYNSAYAERTILNAQIRWYEYKKDSSALVQFTIKKVDKYGLDTSGFGKLAINNIAFYMIFMRTNDKTKLNKAIHWMEIVLKYEPAPGNAEFMDTYANLLYKTGRISEALKCEESAAKLDPAAKDIEENYIKMKNGLPTWR
jgi:hypothetical protein